MRFESSLLIRPISALCSLTILHLTILGQQPDLQPLAALTGLQDLALQCQLYSSSCHDVLDSNRRTLQHVTLASYSWDSKTYETLAGLPTLRSLNVKVCRLALEAARVVGGISAPEAVSIMLRNNTVTEPEAFYALSAGCAKIQTLTLWDLDNHRCQELQSMPALSSLTLVRFVGLFEGKVSAPQPSVTHLTLISCSGITDDGVKNIVRMFPALESLAIRSEYLVDNFVLHDGVPRALAPLSQNALMALSQCQKLSRIDLRGVASVTQSSLQAMEACFWRQWALRKACPSVKVLLSRLPDRSDHTVCISDQLYRPCFLYSEQESASLAGLRVLKFERFAVRVSAVAKLVALAAAGTLVISELLIDNFGPSWMH